MFNLTFYDKPNMSVERTPTPYIITNPIYGLIILSFFCLIIIYLGYREFQKNRLLNKQVKGKITQGNCRTNLTRVSEIKIVINYPLDNFLFKRNDFN